MHKGLNLIHSPAMLSIAEADFLYDVAAVQVGDGTFQGGPVWFELGAWSGRSLWAAGCGLRPGGTITSIDTFSGVLPKREGSPALHEYAPGPLCEHITRGVADYLESLNSLNASVWKMVSWEAVAQMRGLKLNVLVVDAAHDYDSVCKDIDAWLPHMKPDGILIGHDYTLKNPGVVKAFDERFGSKCQKVDGTRFVKVQL